MKELTDREQNILDDYTSGVTVRDIRSKHKCSDLTISNIVDEAGVETRYAAKRRQRYNMTEIKCVMTYCKCDLNMTQLYKPYILDGERVVDLMGESGIIHEGVPLGLIKC
jgi:hypothetical protein